MHYYVQASVDNKDSFPFHRSITATWEEKWKSLAHAGIYPFADGKGDDFDEVFAQLATDNNDDSAVFADPDRYVVPFLDVAARLSRQADAAEKAGDTDSARALFLRSSCICRIARFPIIRSAGTQQAWEMGREAFLRASPYLDPPNIEIKIPHAHASTAAGESTSDVIRAFVRVPNGEAPGPGWPVVLFICGLDAYRTDQSSSANPNGKLHYHVNNGQAVIIVDIPGTADSPAARDDPESADRLWSTVLDWIEVNGPHYKFDTKRIAARGISTGGYYAIRIAHTHANRLIGVAEQGGGCHHMFDKEWINAMNHMEYPFQLADAVAHKFGYPSVPSFLAAEPRKRFSLLETGILDQPCTRLLALNGMDDSIFPIEDHLLLLNYGNVKEMRLINGRGHMGNPESEFYLNTWFTNLFAGSNRHL